MSFYVSYLTNPLAIKTLLWLIINIFGLVLAKYFIQPIKCSEKWKKWFRLKDDRLCIKHVKKSSLQEVSDNISLIKFAMIQFYFANIYNKMDNYSNMLYLVPLYGSIFLFGIAGEINGLQFSLSKNSIKNWTLTVKIMIATFFLIIVRLLSFNIYLSYINKTIFYYLLSMVLIILYYFALCFIYLKDTVATVHIHHWFFGYILSFFFYYDNWWNKLIYSILYGIFIEGLVTYGPTSIFKD